jgi:hypothetical protein
MVENGDARRISWVRTILIAFLLSTSPWYGYAETLKETLGTEAKEGLESIACLLCVTLEVSVAHGASYLHTQRSVGDSPPQLHGRWTENLKADHDRSITWLPQPPVLWTSVFLTGKNQKEAQTQTEEEMTSYVQELQKHQVSGSSRAGSGNAAATRSLYHSDFVQETKETYFV